MCATIPQPILLDPIDWFWAPWRQNQPLIRAAPQPFDFSDCVKRLQRARVGRQKRSDWKKADLADSLSVEEARFWYEAMLSDPHLGARELTEHLQGIFFDHDPDDPIDLGKLRDKLNILRPEVLLPLVHFLSPEAIVELLLLGEEIIPEDPPFAPSSARFARSVLREGFRQYLLPYLDSEQRENLRFLLRGRLDLEQWPTDNRSVPIVFSLAASLGMHEELLPLIESWPDPEDNRRTFVFQNNERQNVIFGLNGPQVVLHHLRRLRLRPLQPEHARAWLAQVGVEALDWMRDTIQALPKKDQATRILEVLCLVKTPEVAPHMLELKQNSHVPGLARKWLHENASNAIAGLLPLAASRGKKGEVALEQVMELAQLGHRSVVEEQLPSLPTGSAARIRRELLKIAETNPEPWDAKETPAWLRTAMKDLPPSKQSRQSAWWRSAHLPAVIVGKRRLNDEHLQALVTALQQSSRIVPHPLVRVLQERADPGCLALFAWKLLEAWLDEDMPIANAWVLNALAFFGDDGVARKLIALLPHWRNTVRFAETALDCLGAIGTDTALFQLVRIARDPAWKVLQNKSSELLDRIAELRGLSREQLEDSLLPGPGSKGMFDFGSRYFPLILGPDLKPRILDQTGRLIGQLPRPKARDDRRKSSVAIQQWQSMKLLLRNTTRMHIKRLEEAMVGSRRWPVEAFESLLGHPLLGLLARRLLWGGYDESGRLVWAFRIAEEGCCVGLKDEPCPSDEVRSLGIIHPAELTEQEARTWQERLADPPFAQLNRVVVRLNPEPNQDDLTGYDHLAIPASHLWRTLRKQGWTRAGYELGLSGWGYVKRFAGRNITAVLELEGTGALGASGRYDWLVVRRCYFLGGQSQRFGAGMPVPLVQVGQVALSEVSSDLAVLTSKGQPLPEQPEPSSAYRPTVSSAMSAADDDIPF